MNPPAPIMQIVSGLMGLPSRSTRAIVIVKEEEEEEEEEGMYENELVMVAVNFNGSERVIIYRKNGIEAKKSGNGNYLIK